MSSSESECDLERLVFGENSNKITKLIDEISTTKSNYIDLNHDENVKTNILDFIMDTKGSYTDDNQVTNEYPTRNTNLMNINTTNEKISGRPLWIDPDDENLEVDIVKTKRLKKLRNDKNEIAVSGLTYTKRLRTQYEELYGDPSWLTNHTPTDKQRELFLTTTTTVPRKSSKTNKIYGQSSILSLLNVKDANKSYVTSGVLNAIEFHQNSKIILTGGFNKRIDLFKIDGKKNDHIQCIMLPKFPVYCSNFNGTNELIASSRKPYFYVHDLEKNIGSFEFKIRSRHEERWDKFWISHQANLIAFKGEGGYIPLVCSKTKQWVTNFKISGTFNSGCFSSDGKLFYAFGNSGDVYCWDIGMRRCVYKFTDEGCVCGTAIDIDSNNNYLATGSTTGVVNVYDVNSLSNYITNSSSVGSIKPLKSVMNLTTSISTVKFNSAGNILFIASKQQIGSARIVDMNNQTVLCGWPSQNIDIGRIQNCAFSPDNQWFSMVNNHGRALLYRIRC